MASNLREISAPPALPRAEVHVWQVPMDDTSDVRALRLLLSHEEQRRADSFHTDGLRDRFVVARGWLRRVVAWYTFESPSGIRFETGEFGKPRLTSQSTGAAVEFNLSHSGDLALIAVARDAAVGIDIEEWDPAINHLELAEQFFSASECDALRVTNPAELTAGFFTIWTRKEAYLKATGHGITRRLRHFDVSLDLGGPTRLLLADRMDPNATEKWAMADLTTAPSYSAAIVVETPLRGVRRFDLADYKGQA